MSTADLIVVIEQETGASGVLLSTRLDSLGIDSLEFLNLMMVIKEKFREIPETQFASLDTIGDIAVALSI